MKLMTEFEIPTIMPPITKETINPIAIEYKKYILAALYCFNSSDLEIKNVAA